MDNITDFYVLVNNSGVHVNRTEKIKGKYLNTKFLELSAELSSSNELASLEIFFKRSKNRMIDSDFSVFYDYGI